MTRILPAARRRLPLACLLAASVFACTEPRRADQAKPAPASPLDARVELSDSAAAAGTTVVVTVRVTGAPIASATARLLYDTAGVVLVGEVPLQDGATRVMNPQAGAIRFAGVDAKGFADGRVDAFTFTVRDPSALRAFKLVIDEAHTVSHADAAASLSRKP